MRFALAAALLVTLSASLAGCQSQTTALPSAPPAPAADAIELAESIADCLQQRGWQVEVDRADGGIVSGAIADYVLEKYKADFSACDPSDDEDYFSTFSAAEMEALYERRVSAFECLGENGFARTEPPGLEDFISTLGEWNPYLLSDPYTETDIRALETCPVSG